MPLMLTVMPHTYRRMAAWILRKKSVAKNMKRCEMKKNGDTKINGRQLTAEHMKNRMDRVRTNAKMLTKV